MNERGRVLLTLGLMAVSAVCLLLGDRYTVPMGIVAGVTAVVVAWPLVRR